MTESPYDPPISTEPPETEAPETNDPERGGDATQPPETEAPKEGCGSVIGFSAVAILVAAAAVALKKKD